MPRHSGTPCIINIFTYCIKKGIVQDIYYKKNWSGFEPPQEVLTTWHTGIDMDLMTFIGTKSVKYKENFIVHPTILRSHIKNRLAKIADGQNIDWATAEAIAIGSLLFEGLI